MNDDLVSKLHEASRLLAEIAVQMQEEICIECSARKSENRTEGMEPDQVNFLIVFLRGKEWTSNEEVRDFLKLEETDVSRRIIAKCLRKLGYLPKIRRQGNDVKRMWRKVRPEPRQPV